MITDSKKSIYRALTSIYGIGEKKAQEICASIGVSLITPITEIATNKKDALNAIITKLKKTSPGIETELKQNKLNNIQRLIKINCYRWKTT